MNFIDKAREVALISEELFMQIERLSFADRPPPLFLENSTGVSALPWDFAREYFQIREYAKSFEYRSWIPAVEGARARL